MTFLKCKSDYVAFKALWWIFNDFKTKARLCPVVSKAFLDWLSPHLSPHFSRFLVPTRLNSIALFQPFTTVSCWWLREFGMLCLSIPCLTPDSDETHRPSRYCPLMIMLEGSYEHGFRSVSQEDVCSFLPDL